MKYAVVELVCPVDEDYTRLEYCSNKDYKDEKRVDSKSRTMGMMSELFSQKRWPTGIDSGYKEDSG